MYVSTYIYYIHLYIIQITQITQFSTNLQMYKTKFHPLKIDCLQS